MVYKSEFVFAIWLITTRIVWYPLHVFSFVANHHRNITYICSVHSPESKKFIFLLRPKSLFSLSSLCSFINFGVSLFSSILHCNIFMKKKSIVPFAYPKAINLKCRPCWRKLLLTLKTKRQLRKANYNEKRTKREIFHLDFDYIT